jgi:excisionase family DNA binding protein
MELVMELQIKDRWLSVQEIGMYLGVSKETIYRWLEAKKIPAHKIGKQWKFKTSDVDNWVTSGEAETN